MSRYWIFQNNRIAGPFAVEELVRLPDYQSRSLVCVEEPDGGRGEWSLACNAEEIAAFQPSKSPSVPAGLSSNDMVQVGGYLEKLALLDSRIAEHKQKLDHSADANDVVAKRLHDIDTMVAEKRRVESVLAKIEALNTPQAPKPFPVADRTFVIMTIDDDPTIRRILQLRLELKGCRVLPQQNGLEALKSLADSSAVKPDLIICDVMMPGMDGYETCRLIRAQGIAVPFLFLTSKSASVDKVRGLEAGADDYILKPFDPHELEAKVARHLRDK
jgi:CheY-like chemotaxis protein